MATTTVEGGGRSLLSLAVGPRLTTVAWNAVAVAIALIVWQLAAMAVASPFFADAAPSTI